MITSQLVFKFNKFNSDRFVDLQDILNTRLEELMNNYQLFDNYLNSICLVFRSVVFYKKKLSLNKDRLSNLDLSLLKKYSSSFSMDYYFEVKAIPLEPIIDDTFIKNQSLDYVDVINEYNTSLISKDKLNLSDLDSNFYLDIMSNNKYNVIITKEISTNKLLKKVFNNKGILINEVNYLLLPDKSMIRVNSSKNILNINKQGVLLSRENKLFFEPKVKFNRNTKAASPNPNTGTLDLETYCDDNGEISNVYAIGFYTSIDEKPKKYYINKDTLYSSQIVLDCINEMLRSKYSDITLYVHNFGKLDFIFIIINIIRIQ